MDEMRVIRRERMNNSKSVGRGVETAADLLTLSTPRPDSIAVLESIADALIDDDDQVVGDFGDTEGGLIQ